MTFDELVEKYKAEVFPKKPAIRQTHEEIMIRLHLAPVFAGKNVGEIVNAEALNYALARDKENVPQSSLTKELMILQNIIRLVKPDFKIPAFKFSNVNVLLAII